MPASVASAPVAIRPTIIAAPTARYGSIRPRNPVVNGRKSRTRPARGGRGTAGVTRANATRAPMSRIGYSQTPGKAIGANSATKADASAPPVDMIR